MELELWHKEFRRLRILGTLISNTREDLLEDKLLKVLARKKIRSNLFLDTTLPTFIRIVETSHATQSLWRLSRHKPLPATAPIKNRVDCFGGGPASIAEVKAAAQE